MEARSTGPIVSLTEFIYAFFLAMRYFFKPKATINFGGCSRRRSTEEIDEVQRRREIRGPRCVKHCGALLCLASARNWFLPLRRMSGLQQSFSRPSCV